jgi:hypothetical protein
MLKQIQIYRTETRHKHELRKPNAITHLMNIYAFNFKSFRDGVYLTSTNTMKNKLSTLSRDWVTIDGVWVGNRIY